MANEKWGAVQIDLQDGGVNNEDFTQYQTEGGQSSSKELSMQATAPPADVPGYKMEQFLGSGAFGQVWVGRDLNTGRPVAIKFFLHRGGVNWSLLSHEVKNLVQLSADRHIVQVLEVGWESDPPYYVMELVTGGSLEEMLTQRGALPVSEAVDLFRQICVGLNHSHSKGVLHCDLKPANILLGEDHEPRLADFGQSRMTHDQSPSLGTLFYMAPEQADLGSTPSSGWDVYAVGAILYRMLTGGPPYRDDSIVEQLDTAGSLPKRLERYRESIQNAPPPSRHVQQAGVDRALSRIVSRCLAADPADRFTNVQEIIQRLDERKESRARRPLMLLGILGPILILLATGVFAARTIDRASESTKAALREEARGSNELAAKFAARTLESELERYFRVCREEINDSQLRQRLKDALKDAAVDRDLTAMADQGTSELAGKMVDTRESLIDIPVRLELERYLESRLARYTNAPRTLRIPRLASIFVTDSAGTIFGIAYDKPVTRDQKSTGRNYSYRTYFHAGKNDLPRSTPIDSIDPLDEMHLSAAFPSTATGLWKVAISAPINLDPQSEDADSNGKPDAVFVITINLGDFELPQSESGANQIAVLLEAREGEMQGTVLQHPYMEKRAAAGTKLSGDEQYQVEEQLFGELLTGEDVTYQDPIAQADDANEYSGEWIAAMQRVTVPREAMYAMRDDQASSPDEFAKADEFAEADQADLMVLVQYRLSTVMSPVGIMRKSLLWDGAAALGSILIVSATLWLLVRRVGDDARSKKKGDSEKRAYQSGTSSLGTPTRPGSGSGSESGMDGTPTDRPQSNPGSGMTETMQPPEA